MNSSVKVLQPSGMLASNQVHQFRLMIDEAIQTEADTVLVDLKHVNFMDSSGLGALVNGLKAARSAGKRLCVCSISDQIRILFELTSMDRVFEIFASQDDFSRGVLSGS